MPKLIQKGLKVSHLRLADALAHEGQLSAAAERLGIAQPAASRLASEAEQIIGAPLFTRAGRGIALTPEGHALATRAGRILHEIDDADREIRELRSGLKGRVAIGSVTGPAIEHVLPALRQVRIALPQIEIEVEVGTSDALGPMVLDGHLDFSLSRLPSGINPDLFDIQMIGPEPVSLVARNEHPVFHRHKTEASVPIRELLEYDWVMPAPGAILRDTVDSAILRMGLQRPQRVLNTSSFLLVLSSISQTNAIAPIATSVAKSYAQPTFSVASLLHSPRRLSGDSAQPHGLVRIVDTELQLEVAEYGIVSRAGRILTPAARSVRDVFRELMNLPALVG